MRVCGGRDCDHIQAAKRKTGGVLSGMECNPRRGFALGSWRFKRLDCHLEFSRHQRPVWVEDAGSVIARI